MKKHDGWQIPFGVIGFLLIGGLIHQMLPWLQAYPIIAGSMIAGTVAISVGLITFSGVRLTLKHATQRMHFELENSRREAEEERKYAAEKAQNERIANMRREVYLQAVEDLMEAQHFLANMPQRDITKGDPMDGLQAFQTSVSKVAVVGEPGTVLLARALSVKFANSVLKATEIVGVLNIEQGKVAFQDKLFSAAQTEIARINAAMIHHNETLMPSVENNARFDALQRSFQIQREFSETAANLANAARKEVFAIHVKFLEMFKQELPGLMEEVEKILNAIRLELGLVTDPAAFAAQSAQLLAQMQNATDKAVENSAALIAQHVG
jgi:hypothetical protein